MKNNHKKQLINPHKIFKFLDKLKDKKNPHYTNINTPEEFQKRCKENDVTGFDVLYGDNDDVIEEELTGVDWMEVDDELLNTSHVEDEDDEIGTEEKQIQNDKMDPVKKYQFKYDESVCMSEKYPEITVAPGEGQTPKGVLSDKHWDVKAFPHLHNLDGSNGKDQERDKNITDQRYFIQRVINKETRFARSPDYLYAAVSYLEQKQIYRNINLVGTRGKGVKSADGKMSYELQDEFRVLENMPNTPKYWRKNKMEVLAKLDNFGPFQMFITLSCADQRWKANFGEILMNKGHTVSYQLSVNEEDLSQETIIQVGTPDGKWKPIMDFIQEDMEDRQTLVDKSMHYCCST